MSPHHRTRAHLRPGPRFTDRLVTRFNTWTGRHRTIVDFLSAALLLVIPGIIADETTCRGLLLAQPAIMAFVWTLVYAFPLALRHTHPDVCAWMTVALLGLRLLIGPTLLISDVAALFALFAGIARGNPRMRGWYTALGLILPPLFCLLDMATYYHDPFISGENQTTTSTSPAGADIFFAVVSVLIAAATIGYAQHRAVAMRQARLLRERNEALELSNKQQEAEAVIAERARLARDMHDVAAHTLSILIVLADGGRYAGAHDSAVALSTMRTIHEEAQKALRNTSALFAPVEDAGAQAEADRDQVRAPAAPRSVFPASLRGGRRMRMRMRTGDEPSTAPSTAPSAASSAARSAALGASAVPASAVPGTAAATAGSASLVPAVTATVSAAGASVGTDLQKPEYGRIDALVQEARASANGRLSVERTVRGRVDAAFLAAHPLVSETLFWMVEESLSNVRKYSGLLQGRRVRVRIEETWDAHGVRVAVHDDGQGTAAADDGHSAGYGLLGMRERVEACGGSLSTGPVPAGEGGGFRVSARIPTTATGAATADTAGTGTAGTVTARGDTGAAGVGIASAGTVDTKTGTADTGAAQSRRHLRARKRRARRRGRLQRFDSPSGFSIADIVISVLVCLTAAMIFLPEILNHAGNLNFWYSVISYIGAVGCAVPLAFLHPRPEIPAAITAAVMGVTMTATMVLNQPLPFLSLVCGLVALYALIAYGPERARMWATPACITLVSLAGVAEDGLLMWHDHVYFGLPSLLDAVAAWLATVIVCGTVVLIDVFLARLHRERGMDPVLLASHRQALLRQREQAGRLAARQERERLSAQIHEEVARTLGTVSDSADRAVVELEAIDRRSRAAGRVSDEDSATIVHLFSQTADTGRKVLAHIRELIGVLRSNETEEESRRVLLAPVEGTEQGGAADAAKAGATGARKHADAAGASKRADAGESGLVTDAATGESSVAGGKPGEARIGSGTTREQP